MRLALKIVLVFILVNIVLATVYGYLALRREEKLFQRLVAEEADEVGPMMERVLSDAWKSEGDRGMRELLDKLARSNLPPMRVRWVWFDTADDDSRPAATVDKVSLQGHAIVEAADGDGGQCFLVYWPVPLDPSHFGGLEFAHPAGQLVANKRDIMTRTALLIAGMALLSILLAVALGIRYIGRPLQQVIAKARRIGRGDLDGPIHLHSRDELGELAENLNAMCADLAESQRKLREETTARIAAMEQLRHGDRLRTVGRLASGIAHELGTPLNVVAGRAGLIGSGKLNDDEVKQSAAAIHAEADKMTRIIRQLLDFARANTPRKQRIDLRTVVRQTIDMLGGIAEMRNIRLNFDEASQAAIAEVDTGQIQQVLTNLTVNAGQAMPQGGPIDFRVESRTGIAPDSEDKTPRPYFTIEVRDEGAGISPEHLPQVFEPFFTTRENVGGTGLGLSIAYGIVQEHGGWIDVASEVGKGSCFTVYLPAGAPA